MDNLRRNSESRVGLGPTAFLGAAAQFGLQALPTAGGVRGVGRATRLDGVVYVEEPSGSGLAFSHFASVDFWFHSSINSNKPNESGDQVPKKPDLTSASDIRLSFQRRHGVQA